ncbi:MAG: GFA family protein [Hyphomicrobiales bacterium]|nr:GFA family protein [Hyphomicrobiales bacterium]MCY4039276.1 GFA family protein [Hyphomicrobiales bacterium]
MSDVKEGRCLCGAVRYKIDAAPEVVAHCHCGVCRRSAGAPVQTWLVLPRSNFHVTKGKMKIYNSSPKGERMFCGDCGTQLVFQTSENPEKLDVSVSSLDDPESMVPTCHVGTNGRLSFMTSLGADLQVAS